MKITPIPWLIVYIILPDLLQWFLFLEGGVKEAK